MDTVSAAVVNLGWLWFDNDPKTSLDAKVKRASGRFREKFGRQPQLCYVSPLALTERETICGRVEIKRAQNVLPGHFLFVVEGNE